MIFKSDPTAALDKARKKLSSVDENLASLRAKRTEVLLTAEDAGAVVAIDQAIEAEQRNAEIYKDRIKALQEECRKVEYQSREDRRKKAITKISARLRKREELASKLQAALTTLGPPYSELMALESGLLAAPDKASVQSTAAASIRKSGGSFTAWSTSIGYQNHRRPA
jgi:chromosome segregation ATPase